MQNMDDFKDFSDDIEVMEIQEAEDKKEQKKTDPKLSILMLQLTACLILGAMALSIKFFGGDFYTEVRQKYIDMFEDTTDVNEVLKLVDNTSSQPSATSDAPVAPLSVTTSEVPETSSDTTTSETTVSDAVTSEDTQGETPFSSEAQEKETLSVKKDNQFSIKEVAASPAGRGNAMYMPTCGEVSSEYGYRINPVTGVYTLHNGIDIAANIGEKVYAALDGVVYTAEYDSGFGKHVIIEHSGGLRTVYAHLSEMKVEEGEKIDKGAVVGLVGSTGRSTGPHLHFEVLRDGKSLNPRYLLPTVLV